jgi:hypothetical protein
LFRHDNCHYRLLKKCIIVVIVRVFQINVMAWRGDAALVLIFGFPIIVRLSISDRRLEYVHLF